MADLADVEFCACVVDIYADKIARFVVIENNTFRDLAAIDAGFVR